MKRRAETLPELDRALTMLLDRKEPPSLEETVARHAVTIMQLRNPWRAVDGQDWDYLFSVIPDGGRGRFWKAVLTEMRTALTARER